MDAFTYYEIDKASFYGPEYQEMLDSASFQEEYERLWRACEEMPGPDYGDCPAWDGLVDAMDHAKTTEALLDIFRLMRAHGSNCNHLIQIKPAPQCAACMCDRRDVVSDRLLLNKPSAVCCGEVA